LHLDDRDIGEPDPMAQRPIGGKIIVSEGVTTIDLRVGAQTVRLTIEEARELARTLASAAMALHEKLWPKRKPKT
jgi:hypothetical protein